MKFDPCNIPCARGIAREISNFALGGAFQHGIKSCKGVLAAHAHAGGKLGQVFHRIAGAHIERLYVGVKIVAVAGQQAE